MPISGIFKLKISLMYVTFLDNFVQGSVSHKYLGFFHLISLNKVVRVQ